MLIVDDAGNKTEVRTGAFISLSDPKKERDKDKFGPKVRVSDLPLWTKDLRLDLE